MTLNDDDIDSDSASTDELHSLLSQDSQQQLVEEKSWLDRKLIIVALCVSIVTFVDFGFYLIIIPLTRVYEINICYNYYSVVDPSVISPDGSIAEGLCKIEQVQSELAFIRGYEGFFMALPSVLLAVPYGMLADKWGRKPILILSFFGLILAMTFMLLVCWFSQIFPLRFVWISWVFTLIGGGAAVVTAIVMTIIADVVEEGQRATVFFQIAVGVLFAQTFATLIASSIMEKSNPWVSIFLGYTLGFAACCGSFLLPETLDYKKKATQPSSDTSPSIDDNNTSSPHKNLTTFLSEIQWKEDLKNMKVTAYETWSIILQDWKIFVLLVSFFINSIGVTVFSILLQYISKRYEWTVARAGFLLSVRAGVNVILYIAILPGLTWLLTSKYHIDSQKKDLYLARGSIIFLPVGFIIIGLAPTAAVAGFGLMVMTLGTGYASLIRSLLTSITEPHHVARIYTAVTVFDTLGSLVSGPVLAALYQWGLRKGGAWLGLPFFFAGVLTAAAGTVLWVVRLPKSRTVVEEVG